MVKLVLSSIVQAFSCLVVVNIRLDLSPKKIPESLRSFPTKRTLADIQYTGIKMKRLGLLVAPIAAPSLPYTPSNRKR